MGIFDDIASRWGQRKEESKKATSMRLKMERHAKDSTKITDDVLKREEKLCAMRRIDMSGYSWNPPEQSTLSRISETASSILRPGPSSLLGKVPERILNILGAIDAVNTGMFDDEIRKLGPVEASEAFEEVDGIIVVMDNVISGLRARMRRLEEEKWRQYALWRKRTGNDSSQATAAFLLDYDKQPEVVEVMSALLCLSMRRDKLSAYRAMLANAGLKPIR